MMVMLDLLEEEGADTENLRQYLADYDNQTHWNEEEPPLVAGQVWWSEWDDNPWMIAEGVSARKYVYGPFEGEAFRIPSTTDSGPRLPNGLQKVENHNFNQDILLSGPWSPYRSTSAVFSYPKKYHAILKAYDLTDIFKDAQGSEHEHKRGETCWCGE